MVLERYNSIDHGVVVDETNQAINTYQSSTKIPIRSAGRGRFGFDVTLTASKFRIKARASASTLTWTNATFAYLGMSEILASGYYEISMPSAAYDLELEWETTNTTNVTKIAVSSSL